MSSKDVRKINDYEIVNSIYVGKREMVIGENMSEPNGLHYMSCTVTRDEIYEYYSNVVQSADYVEVVEKFSERLRDSVVKVKKEFEKENVPKELITADMCNTDIFGENLEGKILVIKGSILFPEYRTASHQIMICTGGNGANPNAIGSSVFCTRVLDELQSRYDRTDILGELKPEYYPEWVKDRLKEEPEHKKNSRTSQKRNHHKDDYAR